MTVTVSNIFRNDYLASGGQTVFTYAFRILDQTHIEVYVNGVLKTITTDYTVTGVGGNNGGTIVFNSGLVLNDEVALILSPPLDQGIDYRFNDKFPEETHEQGLDKLTMIAQTLREGLDRALKFAKFSTFKDKVVPDPEALKLFRWNAAGTELENITPQSIGLVVPATAGPTQIDSGDATAVGSSPDYARGDHQHAVPVPAAPADVTKDTAAAGASVKFAREDHKHDISTANVSNVGEANDEGSAISLARSDHVHKRTVVIRKNSGGADSTRRRINIIEGTNISITVADDDQDDEIDITIAAPIEGAPSGAMMAFGGSTAPSGWKLCDGQEISRTTFAALFAAIGTTYGVGDGSTTFNVPDMRGRFAAGENPSGGVGGNGRLPTNTLRGASAGEHLHVLSSAELAAHNHNIHGDQGGTPGGSGLLLFGTGATPADVGTDPATGSNAGHNNEPPYLVFNYIIKE